MMVDIDKQVAALHALLAGRTDENRRILHALSHEELNVGYAAVVSAAFFELARRRFIKDGKPAGDAEVIAFVADARGRTSDAAEIIDPEVAEVAINFVLGKLPLDAYDNVDDNAAFRAKGLLVGIMVADEDLSEAELDAFMLKVRGLTEESLR
ncbi:hypothetical protein D0T12_08270 [Actinomadura spongiicola]|uniref:Uncharacterized protein n=1 Tax=Actinomadura spongiicola TaxID=2303421 RepID=A0A372GMF0_9ACTN|nr:hypothetical protein [Actinomadura spongiicola]RFS86551.1 hypothetical protein D0T12_08270 [Actinomadura spongiicola]